MDTGAVPSPAPDGGGVGAGEGELGIQVAWFELFYDLVFVSAVVMLSAGAAGDSSWANTGWTSVVFAALWLTWLTTSIVGGLDGNDPVRRSVVVGQMALVLITAAAASDGVESHAEAVAPLLGVVLVSVWILHERDQRAEAEAVDGGGHAGASAPGGPAEASPGVGARWGGRNLAARYLSCAVVLAASWPAPDLLGVAVWATAVGVALIPTALDALDPRSGVHAASEHHLVERLGAFTTIVCGETFIKVGLTVTDGTLRSRDLVLVAVTVTVMFCLWAAYFNDVPAAGMSHEFPRRQLWLAGHLVLHLGLVGVAIGLAELVLGIGKDLDHHELAVLVVPLVTVYVGMAVVGAAGRRRPVAPLLAVRLGAAGVLSLVGAVGWVAGFEQDPTVVVEVAIVAVASLVGMVVRRSTSVVAVG